MPRCLLTDGTDVLKILQMAVLKIKVPGARPIRSQWRSKDSEKHVEIVV